MRNKTRKNEEIRNLKGIGKNSENDTIFFRKHKCKNNIEDLWVFLNYK